KQATGPVPVTMPGHNDQLSPYTQDVDKAQQALNAADYSVDEINEIGIEVAYVEGLPAERRTSLLLKENLSKLGITEVKINATQWANITSRANKKDTTPHLTNVFVTAKYPSPDTFTYMMHHPSAFGSYQTLSWYTTPELQNSLEKARKASSREQRYQLYKEAQKIIVNAYPSIYLLDPLYRVGLNKSVGGFSYYGVLSYERRYYYLYRKGKGRAK
ncbi:MAG: ABC transporter substrate-binding protein, partial [Halobacteriaceae archaeon]